MGLPALFEIAKQFHELELLASSDDLPPEVIRDTLEGLQGTLEAKGTNVAKFVLGLEAEAKMIEDAARQLEVRANRRKKRAESIRQYLLLNMQSCGYTKIEAPEFTISVRKNPEAVEIDDPQSVPEEFMVQPEPPPPRPNKTAIKAALKEGRAVAGCWLRSGERLEIRT